MNQSNNKEQKFFAGWNIATSFGYVPAFISLALSKILIAAGLALALPAVFIGLGTFEFVNAIWVFFKVGQLYKNFKESEFYAQSNNILEDKTDQIFKKNASVIWQKIMHGIESLLATAGCATFAVITLPAVLGITSVSVTAAAALTIATPALFAAAFAISIALTISDLRNYQSWQKEERDLAIGKAIVSAVGLVVVIAAALLLFTLIGLGLAPWVIPVLFVVGAAAAFVLTGIKVYQQEYLPQNLPGIRIEEGKSSVSEPASSSLRGAKAEQLKISAGFFRTSQQLALPEEETNSKQKEVLENLKNAQQLWQLQAQRQPTVERLSPTDMEKTNSKPTPQYRVGPKPHHNRFLGSKPKRNDDFFMQAKAGAKPPVTAVPVENNLPPITFTKTGS